MIGRGLKSKSILLTASGVTTYRVTFFIHYFNEVFSVLLATHYSMLWYAGRIMLPSNYFCEMETVDIFNIVTG